MVLDRADGEGDRINFPQKIIFYPIMKINQWGQYSWLTFLSKDTLWCWYTLLRFHDSSEKKIYSGLRQKNPYYFQMPSSTCPWINPTPPPLRTSSYNGDFSIERKGGGGDQLKQVVCEHNTLFNPRFLLVGKKNIKCVTFTGMVAKNISKSNISLFCGQFICII